MSPQSGISSGSTIDNMFDTILRRLDSMEEKLQPLGRHLAGVGGDGDDTLHVDDNFGECGMGNGGILAVGEGDDAHPTDDDSDVPSGSDGGKATTPVIGMIDADCSLDVSNILAVIGGGAIGTICGGSSVAIGDSGSIVIDGGGGNLDVDGLHVGGGNNTDVMLGICTVVVLAGDDLGGVTIWRKPKRWQRRCRQRG
jgi:hypothetical protein